VPTTLTGKKSTVLISGMSLILDIMELVSGKPLIS
jgi:hypothetical protein